MSENSHEILFLPGTLCNAETFRDQISSLEQQGHQCKVVDFKAANSLQAMAKCAIKQTSAEQFSLVAFSMGAMVAFELLRQYPQKITNIVLIASNAHADLPGRAQLRQEHLHQAQESSLERLITDTYMLNYLLKQDPKHRQLIVHMAVSVGLDVFAAQLEVLASRPDSSELLKNISCPTLIVGGQQDPLCNVDEQKRMAQLISGSQLQLYQDCGHFVSLEQSERLTHSLIEWFREH
jgi:pimeloyl-ACP methyl ester carboxylesterase